MFKKDSYLNNLKLKKLLFFSEKNNFFKISKNKKKHKQASKKIEKQLIFKTRNPLLLPINFLSVIGKYSYYKNKINNFPKLKFLLEKLYNKKLELNIVELKYLHLNANNIIKAISIKLKKRKIKLIKIMKKTLTLAKLPKKINIKPKKNFSNNLTIKNTIKDLKFK